MWNIVNKYKYFIVSLGTNILWEKKILNFIVYFSMFFFLLIKYKEINRELVVLCMIPILFPA